MFSFPRACVSQALQQLKWNLILVFSRSPPSIVEDIHQGKSEHYGSETLREFLKLLPESEEVRNLGHEFLMLRAIIKASYFLGMSELTWNDALLPRARVFSCNSKKLPSRKSTSYGVKEPRFKLTFLPLIGKAGKFLKSCEL